MSYIPARARKPKRKRVVLRKHYTSLVRVKLMELYIEGHSVKKLAQMFGVKDDTIRARIYRLRDLILHREARQRKIKPREEAVSKRMLENLVRYNLLQKQGQTKDDKDDGNETEPGTD